jgi:hypothetical protein
MTEVAFSVGALGANRPGQLSPGQLRDLHASVRYRSKGLVRHLLHSHDAFARDVANGRVESAEGAITKKIWQPGDLTGESDAPPSYEIWVASQLAGNQQFKSGQDFYDFAPSDGMVRLFYLPQSRWAVNFELLPDAPPAHRRLDEWVQQNLLDQRAARQARDVVGEAEVRAEVRAEAAAIQRYAVGSPAGHRPAAGERLEPDALREAAIGDWASPMLSISIRNDGTLTATMASGATSSGRWSVDASGRVVTDVMGAALAIDASIAGDVLTLVINGRTLNLRRLLA